MITVESFYRYAEAELQEGDYKDGTLRAIGFVFCKSLDEIKKSWEEYAIDGDISNMCRLNLLSKYMREANK